MLAALLRLTFELILSVTSSKYLKARLYFSDTPE